MEWAVIFSVFFRVNSFAPAMLEVTEDELSAASVMIETPI
jgi:hypothetical protein